jgi:DNA binding domain, excisionase family
MDNDVLNLEQAIEFFGVSERTMIKLLREERIPARKIGREWRFNKSALLRWLGEGDSVNYLNQTELYRIADDTKAEMSDLLTQISDSLDKLKNNGGNMRALLPEMEKDVCLPDDATLRVSYKRQREIEKLTFKIFWLNKD